MKTASVNLTQKEANLLLKILEGSLDHPAADKNINDDIRRLWSKIFDSGLDAGFGEIK